LGLGSDACLPERRLRGRGGGAVCAGDDGVTADAVAENFGASYPRLARLEARYDPDNLFRLNANIRPSKR